MESERQTNHKMQACFFTCKWKSDFQIAAYHRNYVYHLLVKKTMSLLLIFDPLLNKLKDTDGVTRTVHRMK